MELPRRRALVRQVGSGWLQTSGSTLTQLNPGCRRIKLPRLTSTLLARARELAQDTGLRCRLGSMVACCGTHLVDSEILLKATIAPSPSGVMQESKHRVREAGLRIPASDASRLRGLPQARHTIKPGWASESHGLWLLPTYMGELEIKGEAPQDQQHHGLAVSPKATSTMRQPNRPRRPGSTDTNPGRTPYYCALREILQNPRFRGGRRGSPDAGGAEMYHLAPGSAELFSRHPPALAHPGAYPLPINIDTLAIIMPRYGCGGDCRGGGPQLSGC